MEIWKDVVGYEGLYEVSDMGRVRSLRRKAPKILKQWKGIDGYFNVGLYNKEKKQKKCFVHQLVAEAFVPNPDNKSTIDHINMKKDDNRACNLRWATMEEQNEYKKGKSYEVSEFTKMKVKNMETGEIFENSAKAAHWVIDHDLTTSKRAFYVAERIRFAAQGNIYGRKTAFGHTWVFIK